MTTNDFPDLPKRRRPAEGMEEKRRTIAAITPIRDRLGDWNERGAKLEAIGRSGRGSAAHRDEAGRMLSEIETAIATLLELAAHLDKTSGHLHDLEAALENAAKVARRAVAALSDVKG